MNHLFREAALPPGQPARRQSAERRCPPPGQRLDEGLMPLDASDRIGRPDPEALLRSVQAAERTERRGQLKIFLGYASGVGKSFRMFDEGRRRRERGEDVIVAALQPNMDPDTEAVARPLENLPTRVNRRRSRHRCSRRSFARHPQVALVDGLGYDNPAGSRHPKRYQDVEETARCRHFRDDVDQPRVHRRAAGIRANASRARCPSTGSAAGLHQRRRRGGGRRCAAGGRHTAAGAATVTAPAARTAADGGRGRSPAGNLPPAAWHRVHLGARRNASWCA